MPHGAVTEMRISGLLWPTARSKAAPPSLVKTPAGVMPAGVLACLGWGLEDEASGAQCHGGNVGGEAVAAGRGVGVGMAEEGLPGVVGPGVEGDGDQVQPCQVAPNSASSRARRDAWR